jgi:ATP-dependent DNA helicase RecQ
MLHEAERVLSQLFGHAAFRPLQRDAVSAFLAGRDVTLVLPTAAGKSACFQVPAVVLAREGRGPTLVVSPLIALMEDQVAGLCGRGVRARALHSGMTGAEQREVLADLASLDLLYTSPERLQSPHLRRALVQAGVARAAIDEAHCISEWGHDFRPEYRALSFLKTELGLPLMALTATATTAVAADIERALCMRDAVRLRGSFQRDNLQFAVHLARGATTRTHWVCELLRARDFHARSAPGHAIVYATTRKRAQTLQQALRKGGIRAGYYHAGRKDSARERAHALFELGTTPVLVATSAYGMGIDIPTVRLVIHAEAPATLEAYVQQSGRAGRDGRAAECWLGFAHADARIHALLQRRSAATKEPAAPAAPETAAGALALDAGFAQLRAYALGKECRQRVLARHFGEEGLPDCGRCDVCRDSAGVAHQLAELAASARPAAGPESRPVHVSAPLSDSEQASVIAFVDALKKPIGRRLVVKGLRGSRAREVVQKRLTENLHFAALRDHSEEAIFAALDALLARGLLVRKGKKYPTLWVAGKAVRSKRAGAGIGEARRPRTLELSLKTYRRAQARRRRIKPYQVFQNRTLQALCEARPRNEAQLLAIWGLGEERVRKYGADLLALLAEAG